MLRQQKSPPQKAASSRKVVIQHAKMLRSRVNVRYADCDRSIAIRCWMSAMGRLIRSLGTATIAKAIPMTSGRIGSWEIMISRRRLSTADLARRYDAVFHIRKRALKRCATMAIPIFLLMFWNTDSCHWKKATSVEEGLLLPFSGKVFKVCLGSLVKFQN